MEGSPETVFLWRTMRKPMRQRRIGANFIYYTHRDYQYTSHLLLTRLIALALPQLSTEAPAEYFRFSTDEITRC